MTHRGASDNSPCTEEPDECEKPALSLPEGLMSGSEAAARGSLPLPTVTVVPLTTSEGGDDNEPPRGKPRGIENQVQDPCALIPAASNGVFPRE